jgi:hypothetical protein
MTLEMKKGIVLWRLILQARKTNGFVGENVVKCLIGKVLPVVNKT